MLTMVWVVVGGVAVIMGLVWIVRESRRQSYEDHMSESWMRDHVYRVGKGDS